jgi:hypothetical protein
MSDSSFDPLGLVKAMGPQRDPYSWAELYAADASKHQLSKEEMKNRLLLQEMQRAERAKEGALDRGSREGIARESQAGQDRRIAERLKQWQITKAAAEKNFRFPRGAFPADAETAKSMGIGVPNPVDVAKTHELVTVGPHKIYVPVGTDVTPIKYPAPLSPNPEVPSTHNPNPDGY